MSSKQNVLPIAGLLSGALVWGLVWYPYRALQESGVAGPVATLISYILAMLCGGFMLPRVWRELRRYYGVGAGWWVVVLVLSAGWANLGYVLAMLHGEVMRVLLLFYLAPLWTILFSYWLLRERLDRNGYLVMALSCSGAAIMLWQPQHGLPLPLPQNLSEWIGLSAGMGFSFSNVVSRRAAHLSVEAKTYSVLFGTALLTVPLLLWQGGAALHLPGSGYAVLEHTRLAGNRALRHRVCRAIRCHPFAVQPRDAAVFVRAGDSRDIVISVSPMK